MDGELSNECIERRQNEFFGIDHGADSMLSIERLRNSLRLDRSARGKRASTAARAVLLKR